MRIAVEFFKTAQNSSSNDNTYRSIFVTEDKRIHKIVKYISILGENKVISGISGILGYQENIYMSKYSPGTHAMGTQILLNYWFEGMFVNAY